MVKHIYHLTHNLKVAGSNPAPTTVSFLRDLIGFPTVSHDPNRDLIDYCANYLRSIGASVDIITAEAGRKANLYATIGPQDDAVWPYRCCAG